MSDAFDHSGFSADDMLAAELALGVLGGVERAMAQSRAMHEPAFAALVVQWEERLAPWAVEIAEVTPSPQVWNRISAALPTAPNQKQGLWQNLAFWRGLTLATGALAAVCIGILIYLGNAPQPQQPLFAAIDGGGHHHFVATLDKNSGSVAVVPASFSADATRVPELWLIPSDGKPRPLGLLRADRAVTLTLSREMLARAVSNAVLAVSLEPPGGSPTGAPTGPVIATGKLTLL
jgi:anti-sigma-K factor RskA